jgi:hypothetical protein
MFDSYISEVLCVYSECADETRASGNLGDIPLVVLTAGIRNPMATLPAGLTRQDVDFNERVVNDLQVEEARLSTRGKQVMVPDSDHMMTLHRPDAIVTAVRDEYRALK